MINQTHSGPKEYARKKRREYLWEKGKAYALALAGVVLSLPFLWLAVWFLRDAEGGIAWHGHIWRALVELVFAVLPVGMVAQSLLNSHREVKRASALPYVPPVRARLDTLAAEEILVRGSEEPAAMPCELLRAAHEGTETDSANLLRAETRSV